MWCNSVRVICPKWLSKSTVYTIYCSTLIFWIGKNIFLIVKNMSEQSIFSKALGIWGHLHCLCSRHTLCSLIPNPSSSFILFLLFLCTSSTKSVSLLSSLCLGEQQGFGCTGFRQPASCAACLGYPGTRPDAGENPEVFPWLVGALERLLNLTVPRTMSLFMGCDCFMCSMQPEAMFWTDKLAFVQTLLLDNREYCEQTHDSYPAA